MATDYTLLNQEQFEEIYKNLQKSNVAGSLLESSSFEHGLVVLNKISYPLESGFLILDRIEYYFWNDMTDELELESIDTNFSFIIVKN